MSTRFNTLRIQFAETDNTIKSEWLLSLSSEGMLTEHRVFPGGGIGGMQALSMTSLPLEDAVQEIDRFFGEHKPPMRVEACQTRWNAARERDGLHPQFNVRMSADSLTPEIIAFFQDKTGLRG